MPVVILPAQNRYFALLHVFIPKTGGTALMRFFEQIGCTVLFQEPESARLQRHLRVPFQHFHYSLLREVFSLDQFSLVFAVVRNPLDRIRSEYVWSLREQTDPAGHPSFDRWLDEALAECRLDPSAGHNHLRPQVDFVGEKVSRIYRYEDGLEAVAKDLLRSCGASLIATEIDWDGRFIEARNTSLQKSRGRLASADVEISPAALARVVQHYRADFERFYPEVLARLSP